MKWGNLVNKERTPIVGAFFIFLALSYYWLTVTGNIYLYVVLTPINELQVLFTLLLGLGLTMFAVVEIEYSMQIDQEDRLNDAFSGIRRL